MDQLFSLFSRLNLHTLRLPIYIRYLFALGMVYIAYVLKLELVSVTPNSLFVTFFLGITLSAWFGGGGPGIFATVVSALAADYFFLDPIYSFKLTYGADIILLIVFISQGALISMLIAFMHRYMMEVEESIGELQESERRFKQLYDSNMLGVVFWNMNGQIAEGNEEFLNMLGYTAAELKETPLMWDEITPLEYKKTDDKAMKELKSKGICTPFMKEYFRKDGSRVPVLITASILDDDTYDGVAYILDMTEEKQAEQQRELFIGFVSHELKNPLSSIKAYTQLLKKRLIKHQNITELPYIGKIEEKINLLTRLLNDMLDITKLRAGKLDFIDEDFNLNNMIKNVVDDMQKIAKNHTILLEGSVETKMYGDKTRIIQVFVNLLSNAIKYSPKAKEVKVTIAEEGNYSLISIQDFGIGISKEEQRTIFEPLFRSEKLRARAFPGTGLGLYIAFEIVRHYKGYIILKSEEGVGSTFTVKMPFKRKNN